MTEEFNVDWKAACEQLNLAHVARKKYILKNKKLKQTNASANLVQYRFKFREGSPEGTRNMGQSPVTQVRLEIQFMGLVRRVKFEGTAPTRGRNIVSRKKSSWVGQHARL